MKTAAVICEYNPFHFGHKYQLDQTRAMGATHIAAIMSGDFTQRGDAAVFDKFERARIALENGADLVVELPVRFSLCAAEGFASGAVGIISALGCVDMLLSAANAGAFRRCARRRVQSITRCIPTISSCSCPVGKAIPPRLRKR